MPQPPIAVGRFPVPWCDDRDNLEHDADIRSVGELLDANGASYAVSSNDVRGAWQRSSPGARFVSAGFKSSPAPALWASAGL